MKKKPLIRSTTVLCVRKDGKVVMAGDGQVTLGEGVIKHNARKIRRLYQDKILAGFAGSTADAFSLFARFEAKLEQYRELILLRNYAGASWESVAEETNRPSAAAARMMHARAVVELGKLLREAGVET